MSDHVRDFHGLDPRVQPSDESVLPETVDIAIHGPSVDDDATVRALTGSMRTAIRHTSGDAHKTLSIQTADLVLRGREVFLEAIDRCTQVFRALDENSGGTGTLQLQEARHAVSWACKQLTDHFTGSEIAMFALEESVQIDGVAEGQARFMDVIIHQQTFVQAAVHDVMDAIRQTGGVAAKQQPNILEQEGNAMKLSQVALHRSAEQLFLGWLKQIQLHAMVSGQDLLAEDPWTVLAELYRHCKQERPTEDPSLDLQPMDVETTAQASE